MPKNQKLTIAVVLISYNQQEYITEALDGIRSQTREPDQVVIADDGSTDNTQEIIRNYVNQHGLNQKWLLLLSPNNRGINENYQNAIDHTSAKIIIGMAGDDISLPNRCSVTEELFIRHTKQPIISTSGYVINETGKLIKEILHPDHVMDDVAASIRHGNPRIMPIGHGIRREIYYDFGRLPTDIPNEDDQVTFRGLISGGIACSSIKTFKYRIHSRSASAWLHKTQSDDAYYERFIKDMKIRARHMHYWQEALKKSKLDRKNHLIALAHLKADLYTNLSKIDETTLIKRIAYLLHYKSVVTLKDAIYYGFGRNGILLWKKLRIHLGRA